ncbi:ribonucleoprotein A, chloroplastic [Cinnamomum micranthum f. kanehirae]|uniref:Ribonucleoprotein A, chloroplastic n=1 Tax=Cinnamomum micranthum f. kanehirae TaxID=337451 RepID=A0A3S3P1V7_9MAGN|nr:ribonucleoprotein A, chloroplastic [Cinnamomum micranthum f. kanehirae]
MTLAAASLFFPSPSSSSFLFSHKPTLSLHLRIPLSTLSLSPNYPIISQTRFPNSNLHVLRFSSAAEQVVQVEEDAQEETQSQNQEEEEEKRRKLFVFNLPWSFSAPDITNLFSQCGVVKHVEMIKEKGGRKRGFGFVTMVSGKDAQAVIDKFNSYELEGRIIKVEFAKRMRKPPPPPPPPPEGAVVRETRHKIYVSNLQWKVRSSHLKEFFSATCKPVSARVVFESQAGRSAGYGFVSFTTKEEAEAAIIAFNGKELMGRPLQLKMSQKNINESGDTLNDVENTEGHLEES